MFKSARIKLTVYYLAIILLISGLFSAAFYNLATREINRIMVRFQFEDQAREIGLFRFRPLPPNAPTIEELTAYKKRVLLTLLGLNGLILVVAGTGGWFLAGKTLYPIKLMVDNQNQFISDASHELRTPIATLQAEMEGQLLEKKITDRQARKLISSNLEELGSLKNLANSLLLLSKTNSRNDQSFEAIEIGKVVEIAVKKVAVLAKKNRIEIITKLPKVKITGNREALVELLVILLDNAVKYSREKTAVKITGKIMTEKVSVSVTDHGVGISKADVAHLFERFYRADKSRSQTEGFGLGLAIAKKIVETHRGSISVVSAPGRGSTFTFELPRC